MNDDTLERLLIDRYLGELEPDAGELLEAYLEFDPRAAALAGHIDVTLEQARRVLQPPTGSAPVAAPSLSRARRLAAVRAGPRGKTWHRALAVAAAIALAFFLGTQQATPPSQPTSREPHVILRPQQRARGQALGFWSVARLRQDKTSSHLARSETAEWTTPLVWPRIGEKL